MKATTNREKILELGMSFNNTFPYIINRGMSYIPSHHCLLIVIITDHLIVATESVKESLERLKTTCFICGYWLAADPSQCRNHIAQHVLKCMRKIVEDPKPINEVSEYCSFVCYLINIRLKIGVHPCSTCGRSTTFGNCSITIAKMLKFGDQTLQNDLLILRVGHGV